MGRGPERSRAGRFPTQNHQTEARTSPGPRKTWPRSAPPSLLLPRSPTTVMTSPDARHDRLVEALLDAARAGAVPVPEPDGDPTERGDGAWALFEARLLQARALVNLPPCPAPPSLDGFVVAALQAGVREQRAVAAVRGLAADGPLVAPTVLAERVAAAIDRRRAPDALDTYVAERLALPGAGLAQSFLARLPRLAAPDDLAERLATAGDSGTAGLEFRATRARGWFGRVGVPRAATSVAALVVTGVLMVWGLSVWGLGSSGGDAALSDWSRPVVVRPKSKQVVARVEPARPAVALTFEFVAFESFLDAPLSAEQRARMGGLVGEPMGGGS